MGFGLFYYCISDFVKFVVTHGDVLVYDELMFNRVDQLILVTFLFLKMHPQVFLLLKMLECKWMKALNDILYCHIFKFKCNRLWFPKYVSI